MPDPAMSPPFAAAASPSLGLNLYYRRDIQPQSKLFQSFALHSGEKTFYGQATVSFIKSSVAVAATQWRKGICLLGVASDNTLWFVTAEPSEQPLGRLLASFMPSPGINPKEHADLALHPEERIPIWSEPVQLPARITTIATPALTVFRDKIYAFFLSSTGNGRELWCTSSVDGKNWDLNLIYGALSKVSPAAASFGGWLYVLFKSSSDSSLFLIKSSNGMDFVGSQLELAITTTKSPSLAATSNALYGVFRSSADNSLWILLINNNPMKLRQLPSEHQTLYAPITAVLRDTIYVAYANLTGTVSLTTSTDGQNWSKPLVFEMVRFAPAPKSSWMWTPYEVWTPT